MPFSAKALLSPPQSPSAYFRERNSVDEACGSPRGALCAAADAPDISSTMKHKKMLRCCAQNLGQHGRKVIALLQRRIAVWINEWTQRRSTCLFFIATGGKALALPNTRTSCASSKSRFPSLFPILNQQPLMAPTCHCF